MALIKSFKEYCQLKGITPESVLPDVTNVPEKHQKAIIATTKMYLIAEELNEGKEPDWNDMSERKWYPWFDMEVDKNNPSGFRFSASSYVCTVAGAGGGSRLCFKTEAISDHAGKKFLDLWKDMMVLPK